MPIVQLTPPAVAIVLGLLLYLPTFANGKINEIGRLTLAAGLFALLFLITGTGVHTFH